MRKRSAAATPPTTTPAATTAEERTLPLLPGLGAATWYCTICSEQFPYTDCSKREDGGIECPVCAGPAKPLHAAPTDVRDALGDKAKADAARGAKAPPAAFQAPPSTGLKTADQLKAATAPSSSTRVDVSTNGLASALQERQDAKRAVIGQGSAVAQVGDQLTVTWGGGRMPEDRFNNFTCGPFSMTVTLAPNEDPVSKVKEVLVVLEKIADAAFDQEHAWYQKKLLGLGASTQA